MFEIRPFEKRRSVETYNPFREMDELEKAFFGNDFFGDDFFPMMAMPMSRGLRHGAHSGFNTDIQDLGDKYLLEADLPGFNKEDINIEFDDDVMTIKAQRHSEHEEKDNKGNYVRCERSYGSYQRSFDMSGINTEDMKAEYKNGVLKLTMPKKEEVLPQARTLAID